MEYIKQEVKKLLGFFLIAGAFYISIRSPILELIALAGVILMVEHLYSYGHFSFYDFLGHEWFGLILCLIGFGFSLSSVIILVAFLINISFYFKEPGNPTPYQYALQKLKYVFKK